MRVLFPFVLTKNIHRFLLIMRTQNCLFSLYVGIKYTRLVYTSYKHIFYMIAVLIVYIAANDKNRNEMKNIYKQESNKT